MIAWSVVENAITAWFVAASGIAAGRVIWDNQNGPRPAEPYITIGADIESVGHDWLDTADASTPAPGVELEYFARGTRHMTLRVRCFGGDAKGATSSKAYLDNIVSKYILPSIHDALVAAGVGVLTFSKVINIGGVLNSTRLEPRATLDIVCSLSSEISEFGTYFSKVTVTDEISDPDNVYTVDGGV